MRKSEKEKLLNELKEDNEILKELEKANLTDRELTKLLKKVVDSEGIDLGELEDLEIDLNKLEIETEQILKELENNQSSTDELIKEVEKNLFSTDEIIKSFESIEPPQLEEIDINFENLESIDYKPSFDYIEPIKLEVEEIELKLSELAGLSKKEKAKIFKQELKKLLEKKRKELKWFEMFYRTFDIKKAAIKLIK